MTVQRLSVAEVLRSLRSTTGGLTQAEATRRLTEFGPNCIHRELRAAPWRRFLKECTHLLAAVLWVAALLCLVAFALQGDRSMLTLGLVIVAVILINAVFSFWQETRAEHALEALERLLPHQCLVLRDGAWTEIPATALVPGDIVDLREGNEVAADMRVVDSHRLRINAATITGESLPTSRTADPCDVADVLHAENIVLAGTTVVAGRGRGVVYSTGDRTSFGRLAALTQATKQGMSPLQREIQHVSRIIAVLAAALGFLFFAVGWGTGLSAAAAVLFGIGILVANVPEGLLPTVTLSLAMAAQRMAKRQVAIRHLPAVEALGQATVICTDKTGTLTENDLRVRELMLPGRLVALADDGAYKGGMQTLTVVGDISRHDGDPVPKNPGGPSAQALLTGPDVEALLVAMMHTHSLAWTTATPEIRVDAAVGATLGWPAPGDDPLEWAMLRCASEQLSRLKDAHSAARGNHGACTRVGEIPFDAGRRRQSVVVRAADGTVTLLCKGAPEVLVERCTAVLCDTGAEVTLGCDTNARGASVDEAWVSRRAVLEAVSRAAEDGLKILAYARRRLTAQAWSAPFSEPSESLEQELVLLGFVALADPLRSAVPDAVSTCRKAGVRVVMVTGDHPATARAVCKQAGIFTTTDAVVVDGFTLGHWTEAQLRLCLRHSEVAFARVRADQKLRIAGALQSMNEVVAMTGDGVNDAPALRQADIGIAMGKAGTDVARESAAMVLLDDNFASIVAAIEEGRAVFVNTRRFLTYILSSNIPEVVPYLCYVILGIPLPLTVIQILAVDLGTDMVPALGLGAEVPRPGLMEKPPPRKVRHLLDGPLLLRAYLWLGMWEAVAAMLCYFVVLFGSGWEWGLPWPASHPAVRAASSATFAAIVCMQVVNVFLCRREAGRATLDLGRLPRNPLVLWGVLLEIVLVFVLTETPGLNEELGMAPLPARFWVAIVPMMGVMWCAEMLRLRVWRRRRMAQEAVLEA